MRCGAQWSPGSFTVAYGRADSADAATVVRYVAYVDIGMEFCNTTLAASRSRSISAEVFERHYRPLIRLFLAENYPFLLAALDGPYLPTYVRDELAAAVAEGWDWPERHARLGSDQAILHRP